MIITSLRVGNGGRYTQLNLGAGSGFAPEIHACADLFRTFPDSGQPPVSGAPAVVQNFRVDAFSVVANAQAKPGVFISNLGFDLVCIGVPESVSQ
jgi:hypothetical protein